MLHARRCNVGTHLFLSVCCLCLCHFFQSDDNYTEDCLVAMGNIVLAMLPKLSFLFVCWLDA